MILRIILTVLIIIGAFSIPLWVSDRGPDNVPKNLSGYISTTEIITWIMSMSLMVLALVGLWF